MKRKNLMIVVFAFATLIVRGQEPTWTWAAAAGGFSSDEGYSIIADANGGKYVTGYFQSPTIVFGNDTLYNMGGASVFIVKYNSSDQVVWAKSSSGSGSDIGRSITLGEDGTVYVAGYFESPVIHFDNDSLINNSSRSHIFIVKYDAGGNVLWAKGYGGNNHDYAHGITTDGLANVYLTGYFTSLSLTIGSTTLVNSNSCDDSVCAFLAKFDPSGNPIWAKTTVGCSMSYAVATDSLNNSYVTGFMESDSMSVDNYTLFAQGGYAMWIAKYDPNGNVVWAKNSGGMVNEGGNALVANGANDIYLTGYFNSSSITLDTITLTNNSLAFKVFVAKYQQSSGHIIWAKIMGGNSDDIPFGIAKDGNGIYITGDYTSSVIYFANDTLINAGSYDVFIAKYDTSGNPVWAKTGGGPDAEHGYGIAVSNSEEYITGSFASPIAQFGNYHLTNNGNLDFYIAQLSLLTTSVFESEKIKNNISFYPNPFSDQTTLVINGEIKDNLYLMIYNLLGQEVRSIPVGTNTQVTINRDHLASGMYFYKLIDENKEVIGIGKMVIE